MDTVITSSTNESVKRLRRLATSQKARRDENCYIAEGSHLVRSFLNSGSTPSSYVVSESASMNPEISALASELAGKGVAKIVLTDSLFESVATIHAAVGILLICALPPVSKSIGALSTDTLVLEDIQDSGNLGTILRTASAAGISTVILSPRCASAWSPKALRAGMGAQFNLVIYTHEDLAGLLAATQIPVYVTTLSSQSVSVYDIDLRMPCAWIFGNEGQGVTSQLMGLANTTHVSIPQVSGPVESLNVSAAAAVCIYEQCRQRGA